MTNLPDWFNKPKKTEELAVINTPDEIEIKGKIPENVKITNHSGWDDIFIVSPPGYKIGIFEDDKKDKTIRIVFCPITEEWPEGIKPYPSSISLLDAVMNTYHISSKGVQ